MKYPGIKIKSVCTITASEYVLLREYFIEYYSSLLYKRYRLQELQNKG